MQLAKRPTRLPPRTKTAKVKMTLTISPRPINRPIEDLSCMIKAQSGPLVSSQPIWNNTSPPTEELTIFTGLHVESKLTHNINEPYNNRPSIV